MRIFRWVALAAVPVLASAVEPAFTVRFDRQVYTFQDAGHELIYVDSAGRWRVPVGACDRELIEPIRRKWEALSSSRERAASTADDVRVHQGGRDRAIARGTPIGAWLRAWPARIAYLETEARLRCRQR